MGGENWKKYRKIGSGRLEMAGDLSIIVNSYLWKQLKKEEDS